MYSKDDVSTCRNVNTNVSYIYYRCFQFNNINDDSGDDVDGGDDDNDKIIIKSFMPYNECDRAS